MQFPSQTDLAEHRPIGGQRCEARLPPQRENRLRDVEDGVTPDIQLRLLERASHRKVGTWRELWMTLFPNDAAVPPPSTLIPSS